MSNALLKYLSVYDYLHGERHSDIKHEYSYGQVLAMAGASLKHNLINGNLYGLLWNQLRNTTCFPMAGDMLVKTSDEKYRYPDLFVACDDDSSDDDYVREQPILVVEVLSTSTRRRDKTEKREEYIALPSLQEYVLIEQDFAEVQIQRCTNHWQAEYFYLGDEIHFQSINTTVSIADIYQRVNNDDVKRYLEELAKNSHESE
ncbi:MAG TPA: Uma2 family endonuclease [Thiothrix sp.]|nr:Uma2 family endonuclease [Thiothrix sp.]